MRRPDPGKETAVVRLSLVLASWCLLLPVPAGAQSADEIALAREIFTEIQVLSVQRNREYCGLIGRDEAGQLIATKPRRGRRTSCRPRYDLRDMRITASYHTHAAHREDYDNEVPSLADVEGDMADGINGYVATPGGRLWFVDGITGESRLICGPRCLPSDAAYRPDPRDPIADRYTLEEIRRRTGY
ncbi:MAG: DUF4329 domain-containing protein [Rhodobacteraceae bacterium]|nr:DUF4329 domain-containing protein [Paracoccaceae bacterium]